jgi:signal transduction histidine kinase
LHLFLYPLASSWWPVYGVVHPVADIAMRPDTQSSFVLSASVGLVILVLADTGFYPVTWWLFLLVFVLFALGLLRRKPLKEQFVRVGILILLGVLIGAVYLTPWPGRKAFLIDLYSIKVGATEAEVRQIMGKYHEGTGWPAIYGDSPSNPGTLIDLSTGTTRRTGATASGEMTIPVSLVFRPTNERGDSNWGIIAFREGRVTNVSFSAD